MKVRIPERAEQQHGVQLLRSLGAKVYVLGTVRRRGDHPGTMQTEGIADVEAFLPPRGTAPRRVFLKWEVKAIGGRFRPAQQVYQRLCEEAGVAHVVGPLDALIAWLAAHDYVKASAFPHYRQPAAPPVGRELDADAAGEALTKVFRHRLGATR